MSPPGSAVMEQQSPPLVRSVVFLLGGTSVASLLAWVFGLGSFRAWFLAVSVPGQLLLIVVAVAAARRDQRWLRVMLLAGAVGGLLGTIGYDLARVPFVIAGYRVLAPIDSYGVLAAGVAESSAWTGLLGWSYHFANGVGFGIAYAMVAPRRHWSWGVAWAMLLETATIVTPFATLYALRGGADGVRWVPILIAYAAHVPYGYALGRAVQRPERTAAVTSAAGRFAVPAMLMAVLVGLGLWQAPWRATLADEGRRLSMGASALVVDQRFEPEWLRVPPGGCVTFDNRDDVTYFMTDGSREISLPPGRSDACFDDPGVQRLRTTGQPYAGGFLIVDEHA